MFFFSLSEKLSCGSRVYHFPKEIFTSQLNNQRNIILREMIKLLLSTTTCALASVQINTPTSCWNAIMLLWSSRSTRSSRSGRITLPTAFRVSIVGGICMKTDIPENPWKFIKGFNRARGDFGSERPQQHPANMNVGYGPFFRPLYFVMWIMEGIAGCARWLHLSSM